INNALYKYLKIFITTYLDNILVYSSSTREEYIKYIKKILQKLKEYKLYL
ncbi:hypothetical protein COCSADRAFT_353740, partial [Bipolaris sorokiniana ND90Pr]